MCLVGFPIPQNINSFPKKGNMLNDTIQDLDIETILSHINSSEDNPRSSSPVPIPKPILSSSSFKSQGRFEVVPQPAFVLKTSNKKKVAEWPEGIKVILLHHVSSLDICLTCNIK